MAQLPSIPKGTRDYSPEIMVKRNYIFDTIKSVFKLYGNHGEAQLYIRYDQECF